MSDQPGEHHVIAAWNHRAVGELNLSIDLELGLSIQLELDSAVVIITCAGGLAIALPDILPDLLVHEVVADLRTMALQVDATPSLGPFEDRVLSELLGATLLRGLEADGLHPLAPLDALPRDEDGIVLYRGKLVRVVTAPTTSLTLTFRASGIALTPSAPIVLDFGALLGKTTIVSLVWDFASASLKPVVEGTVSLWDRVVERVLPVLTRAYFKDLIPDAMRARDYDPRADPHLPAHIRELLLRAAGEADNEAAEEIAVPVARGEPHLGFDSGSHLSLSRRGDSLSAVCASGFFIVVPGHGWTRTLRWRALHYDLATASVRIDCDEAVGIALTQGIAQLVARNVVEPIGRTFSKIERDDTGRYQVPVEGATLHLPSDGFTLAVSSGGLSLALDRVAIVTGRPRVFRYAISRVDYSFADGVVTSTLRGTNCLARLFRAIARRRVSAGVAAFLEERLPSEMRADGYDLGDDPHLLPHLSAIFGNA